MFDRLFSQPPIEREYFFRMQAVIHEVAGMNEDISVGEILDQIVTTVGIGGYYQRIDVPLPSNSAPRVSIARDKCVNLGFTVIGDQPQLARPGFGYTEQGPGAETARGRDRYRSFEREAFEFQQHATGVVQQVLIKVDLLGGGLVALVVDGASCAHSSFFLVSGPADPQANCRPVAESRILPEGRRAEFSFAQHQLRMERGTRSSATQYRRTLRTPRASLSREVGQWILDSGDTDCYGAMAAQTERLRNEI